jgi:hypothetical protein
VPALFLRRTSGLPWSAPELCRPKLATSRRSDAPAIAVPVDLLVGPRVGKEDRPVLGLHVGERVEDVGQALSRDLLGQVFEGVAETRRVSAHGAVYGAGRLVSSMSRVAPHTSGHRCPCNGDMGESSARRPAARFASAGMPSSREEGRWGAGLPVDKAASEEARRQPMSRSSRGRRGARAL